MKLTDEDLMIDNFKWGDEWIDFIKIEKKTDGTIEGTKQQILENQEKAEKLEKIKKTLETQQEEIQDAVKQADEWARALDDFIDELKEILD